MCVIVHSAEKLVGYSSWWIFFAFALVLPLLRLDVVVVVVLILLSLRMFCCWEVFFLGMSINNLSRTPFFSYVQTYKHSILFVCLSCRCCFLPSRFLLAVRRQKVVPFARNWKFKETFNIQVWYVIIRWWMKISLGATFGLNFYPIIHTPCCLSKVIPVRVRIKSEQWSINKIHSI